MGETHSFRSVDSLASTQGSAAAAATQPAAAATRRMPSKISIPFFGRTAAWPHRAQGRAAAGGAEAVP